MIKVMIIDEHKSVLDAFSCVVDAQEDMVFVAGASSSLIGEELCAKYQPDVVLTAIYIEKSHSGIELTKKIKERFPNIKVITMSGNNDISYMSEAKKSGANAFISKAQPLAELLKAVRAVVRGEKIFPIAAKLQTEYGEVRFSDRECDVLRLLCKSLKKKEISEILEISPGTVKRHVENMLLKSGCKSSMELVVNVIENRFVAI